MKFDLSKFKKVDAPGDVVEATKASTSETSPVKASGKGTFSLDAVRANANATVQTEENKALAYGAYKYAEVIAENFPNEEIDYMVRPRDIDSSANKDALPIHFLFNKNRAPKVAVVIVPANGYRTPRAVATRPWCETKRIKYIRMYADGTYADWITGESTGAFSSKQELEDYCKGWVVDTINKALK